MDKKPKMRIQLLDDNLGVISDRLVDQYTEFVTGPKEYHPGPIKIELVLTDVKSIEEAKQYLEKVSGLIPVDTPKIKFSEAGRKSHKDKPEIKKINNSDRILAAIEAFEFQEGVLSFFKREQIVMVPMEMTGIEMRDKDKNFDFWVLRTEIDPTQPKNDKFDFDLVIGLKYKGEKSNKLVIYRDGKFNTFLKKPWKADFNINFKKRKKMTKFPDDLSIEDRKHWRNIHDKIQEDRSITTVQHNFYHTWLPKIEKLNKK